MSDIIAQAEACINKRFDKDTVAELFPMLLAECNRLEEVLGGTTRGIEDARYECRRAMAEAARWQEAASTYKEIADSWENGSRYWQKRAEKAETAPGCPPRAWLMTEERIDAINSVLRDSFEITDDEMGVLRAMLAEEKQ